MRTRIGWWLRRLADRIDPHARKGGYQAADVPVSAMGPVPDALKYGQQSPRGTVRPPLVTVQQETPPPSVHGCCRRCNCGGDATR